MSTLLRNKIVISWEALIIRTSSVHHIPLINSILPSDKFCISEGKRERNHDSGPLTNKDKLGKVEMMETLRESDNVILEFVIDQELNPGHTEKCILVFEEKQISKSWEKKKHDPVARNSKWQTDLRDFQNPHPDIRKTDHLDDEENST